MDVFRVIKRSPIIFPLACIAAVALMLISEGSYWQSIGTLNDLGAVGAARTNIQNLQQSILDAENGWRDFLLTGRHEYREAYDQSLKDVDQSLHFLNEYYRGEPKSQEVLRKLRTLTETKLSYLAQTIRQREAYKEDTLTELTSGAVSKEQLGAIRAVTNELLNKETLKVETGRNDIYQTLMLSRIGVAVLSAISLMALLISLRQSFAHEKLQEEQQRMVQDERDRLELEVTHRTVQLTELAQHLQTAREDERNRLARDLHDELGALLTSAKLDAARIKSRLAGASPEALERLTHLVGTLNSVIALKRRIIEDLRPSALRHLGLVATLEILAREFSERTGVEVHCEFTPVRLKTTAELVIYRVTQEAITNITKYAKASNVWLSLAPHDGQVEVLIRDDGIGFDISALPSSTYGLVGMRFRVEAAGGTMTLVSAPSQGALVKVKLPEAELSVT